MTALTKPQLDQLTDQLRANRQALRQEVREELENSGEQHRIAILNAEPGDKQANEDVYVAVRDAFDAAKRRLEDYARQL
ncbi:conserved hypothetical protein [Thiobacillus denitrificans ATCC 25259]|uniref:Uncharacterized protein n=1 Tax=Thiobacillus denitrificans (strain ATCC 25259 / T1) TaxID=292415 RepID=Q3SIW5_THIDA|nr:hypothetical protein [Thiobacillus denitrificans]AAZ97410.1 conserved hypothetical protein [Thiobacillus denitrificans ATCC 25259]